MGSREHAPQYLSTFREWLLTGVALTIPLVITILVLGVVLNFLLNVVSPAVTLVRIIPGVSPVVEGLVIQLISLVLLLAFLVGVGAVAHVTERSYAPKVHTTIERIPGIGELYRTFRQMGDMLTDSDARTFREVKLVEFPHEGAYSLAFVTADTPEQIQTSAGELKMQTLFVPLAPNPMMGGFLVNFAADQITDIDITVEEAIQSIVTSGASIEVADRGRDRPITMDELGEIAMDPINDEFDEADGDRSS
ncbi:DUF502 domain-containing protein [Halobellus ruber]|uniref:DUF502 domain-containing protein n=1 Tax=Halobellus ruber TaxID=2761102 RepID=A0A7J9SHN4_9EURY|nr:DUF502 domain-containing protein [Halobellus ruber]MBB6645516.1 DUF502 domain-containing protein [Halobellus ruber]